MLPPSFLFFLFVLLLLQKYPSFPPRKSLQMGDTPSSPSSAQRMPGQHKTHAHRSHSYFPCPQIFQYRWVGRERGGFRVEGRPPFFLFLYPIRPEQKWKKKRGDSKRGARISPPPLVCVKECFFPSSILQRQIRQNPLLICILQWLLVNLFHLSG